MGLSLITPSSAFPNSKPTEKLMYESGSRGSKVSALWIRLLGHQASVCSQFPLLDYRDPHVGWITASLLHRDRLPKLEEET